MLCQVLALLYSVHKKSLLHKLMANQAHTKFDGCEQGWQKTQG